MQEKTNFDLTDQFLVVLRNGSDEERIEALNTELTLKESLIASMLTGYYTEGRVKVFGVNIENDSIEFYDDNTGCVRAEFSKIIIWDVRI